MKNLPVWPENILLFYVIILVMFPSRMNGQTLCQEAGINTREMYFSHLTRENGLPSDFVMHAVQDFRGYVWIATDNGLARYDGKNITVFQSHNSNKNSIVDNYVIILKESRDSTVLNPGFYTAASNRKTFTVPLK